MLKYVLSDLNQKDHAIKKKICETGFTKTGNKGICFLMTCNVTILLSSIETHNQFRPCNDIFLVI